MQTSGGSDCDHSSRDELAQMQSQVHAAFSRLREEIERAKAMVLAVHLRNGASLDQPRSDEKARPRARLERDELLSEAAVRGLLVVWSRAGNGRSPMSERLVSTPAESRNACLQFQFLGVCLRCEREERPLDKTLPRHLGALHDSGGAPPTSGRAIIEKLRASRRKPWSRPASVSRILSANRATA